MVVLRMKNYVVFSLFHISYFVQLIQFAWLFLVFLIELLSLEQSIKVSSIFFLPPHLFLLF